MVAGPAARRRLARAARRVPRHPADERRDRDARRSDPPRVGCRGRGLPDGIVTAVGADVTGVEPGDKVLYPREAGYEVRLGGIEVKVVKRDDLIARIHD